MDVFKSITLIAMYLLAGIFCGFLIGGTMYLILMCVDIIIGFNFISIIIPFISTITGVITTFVMMCIFLDM